MIDYARLSAMITEKLNELSDKVQFNIGVQVGKYAYQPLRDNIREKEFPIISGTLVAQPTGMTAIKDFENYDVMALLTFTVPKSYIDEVYSTVIEYITENKGNAFTLDDYAVVSNFDFPSVSDLSIRPGAGSSVEIQFFCYYTLIKDGVISNSCVIKIDGEEMTYLSGSIGVAAELEAGNVKNGDYAKNTKTMQSLALFFDIPYRNTEKTVEIVKDVLSGSLDKTYAFQYYDGVAYTKEYPFETTITTKDINISFEPKKIPRITVTATLFY